MSGQRYSRRGVRGAWAIRTILLVVFTLFGLRVKSAVEQGPISRLRNLRVGWLRVFRVSYSDDRELGLFTSDQCVRDFVEQGPLCLRLRHLRAGIRLNFGRVSLRGVCVVPFRVQAPYSGLGGCIFSGASTVLGWLWALGGGRRRKTVQRRKSGDIVAGKAKSRVRRSQGLWVVLTEDL